MGKIIRNLSNVYLGVLDLQLNAYNADEMDVSSESAELTELRSSVIP